MYILGINKLLDVFRYYLTSLRNQKYLKSKNGCNFYFNKPSPYLQLITNKSTVLMYGLKKKKIRVPAENYGTV